MVSNSGLYAYLRTEQILGGLGVTGDEDVPLRDGYFDTTDLVLWSSGGYLRMRREPRRSLVTLRLSRGSPLMPETVESTRPAAELRRVMDDLIDHIPTLPPLPERVVTPAALLTHTGLRHVVGLHNERRVLSIRPRSPVSVYKIKLDKVTYDTWVEPLYEIELDVYDSHGLAWAAEMADSLRARAPGAVHVTTTTKLDRGLVLRELFGLRRGEMGPQVGTLNALSWWLE